MKLKRGILISTMWALCHRLDEQFPNLPARKIKGRMLQAYQSYSLAEKDVIEDLKAQAWKLVEERYEGVANLPIVITELYWSFPEVYGKKVQALIDLMDDLIVKGMDDTELVAKSSQVSTWFVEVIDSVATNFIQEN